MCVALQDRGQSASALDTISDTFSTLRSDRLCLFLQYKTVERVLAERPTVVMMAHINPLKDIVTAIRAAKLIVEEYKVTGVLHCTALSFLPDFDLDRLIVQDIL